MMMYDLKESLVATLYYAYLDAEKAETTEELEDIINNTVHHLTATIKDYQPYLKQKGKG